MNGDRDALRALLKQGADVNAVQGDGVTALHWAATRGDADMAHMLVVAGANLSAATRFGGYTPLHVAAERGYAAVVADAREGRRGRERDDRARNHRR